MHVVFNLEMTLLVIFETDCPTCRLALPYLKALPNVIGVSQDSEEATRALVQELDLPYEVRVDRDMALSRQYNPTTVPALFLLDEKGHVVRQHIGFDKKVLNSLARDFGVDEIAPRFDGNPETKPGCSSRHLEAAAEGVAAQSLDLYRRRGARASRVVLDDAIDPYEYCLEAGFGDPLPVVPPTLERVERMLAAVPLAPDEIVGLIPPNYGAATVEKIAANAVMAGCAPEMMRVLLPLVRAACDEKFNLHGIQGTTHFAAPLVIINGPVRHELGFASRSNVFGNVARANSSLGRALQLMMVSLGGARPGEIDMSTLGHPGKFSYCIAENEEESPWEPLHVERGFTVGDSAITLFAGEAPHGVSEHRAREGRMILKAICRALATVWSYRQCTTAEAFVVLCPEHVRTLKSDGFSKQSVRSFLFENTGIPLKAYEDGAGEGTQMVRQYQETAIDGERCYRKFARPESIHIVVAGGTAGKFSAVIGSWSTGPRGSQSVTYPCPSL
jgi:hypothetical protein